MATHGSVGEFSGASESWVSYIERLKQYFIANNIKSEERQRAVLLSICGASIIQSVVVSSAKPIFDEIVNADLDNHTGTYIGKSTLSYILARIHSHIMVVTEYHVRIMMI